jgi:hypothetical protein
MPSDGLPARCSHVIVPAFTSNVGAHVPGHAPAVKSRRKSVDIFQLSNDGGGRKLLKTKAPRRARDRGGMVPEELVHNLPAEQLKDVKLARAAEFAKHHWCAIVHVACQLACHTCVGNIRCAATTL